MSQNDQDDSVLDQTILDYLREHPYEDGAASPVAAEGDITKPMKVGDGDDTVRLGADDFADDDKTVVPSGD